MINENEKAVAIIQKSMNCFIHETLRILEETIDRKVEILSSGEAGELIRTEYLHTLDELADIYTKCPAVRSIKDYVHLDDFLWESTFIESMTREETHKWLHSDYVATTYSEFHKDNTIYNQAFPYFSNIYNVVVKERYADYLKQKWESSVLRAWDMRKTFDEKSNKDSQVTEQTKGNKQPVTTEPTDRYTFEHILNDKQIASLVDCVNEVRMFKGEEVTFEQLKSIFDCNPIIPLKSNNNRLIAFFFDQLSNHSYIAENWQSVIAKNHLILSPMKDTYLNQSDLSTAVNRVRDTLAEKKLERINLYIRNLKGLSK